MEIQLKENASSAVNEAMILAHGGLDVASQKIPCGQECFLSCVSGSIAGLSRYSRWKLSDDAVPHAPARGRCILYGTQLRLLGATVWGLQVLPFLINLLHVKPGMLRSKYILVYTRDTRSLDGQTGKYTIKELYIL